MMVKPSCLVVEDEPGIQWAIRRLLEQAGANVITAANAAHALEHLARDKISVIFLDVKLPDADGFELAGAINQMAPAIPIVIISAYFYPNDPKVQQVLDRGVARRFIAKPFRHDELLCALREVLAPQATGNGNHSSRSTDSGISGRRAIKQRANRSAQLQESGSRNQA
jgi:two-component system KDP operon response regulator KdpE